MRLLICDITSIRLFSKRIGWYVVLWVCLRVNFCTCDFIHFHYCENSSKHFCCDTTSKCNKISCWMHWLHTPHARTYLHTLLHARMRLILILGANVVSLPTYIDFMFRRTCTTNLISHNIYSTLYIAVQERDSAYSLPKYRNVCERDPRMHLTRRMRINYCFVFGRLY